jgi:hypothetical protein
LRKTKGNGFRFFLTMLTAFSAVLLSSCGYQYKCAVTFGASTCTPSGGGIGTGGNAGANAAFVFNIVQKGSINGISLTSGSSATLENIPNFQAPTVPQNDVSSALVIAQKKFLYAAFPASQLLYGWTIDSSTGQLTAISGSPFTIPWLGGVVLNDTGVNMTAVAVNPAGTLLFIAAAGNGAIAVYQIGSDGTLTQASGSPLSTGGFQPWNLYFDGLGKYLYVTTGPEGLGQQVAAYAIGSTGALTLVPGSPFAFNLWALAGEPSGKYMVGISGRSTPLNGLSNDSNLYAFSIQQSGSNAGALAEVAGSPFATLYAPVNLAVQPNAANGTFVYSFSIASSGYNPIEGYALNTGTGALTVLSASPFANLSPSPWGQFDQSGSNLFVYSSLSGVARLGVLSAATGTGVLTQPLASVSLSTGGYFTVTDAQ